MNPEQLCNAINAKFPKWTCRLAPQNEQAILAPREVVPELFEYLHSDPETDFSYLEYITAVDYPPDRMQMVYSLYSFNLRHRAVIMLDIDRSQAKIPTLAHIWNNADWNEREIFDLLGVEFVGHPDLRRLMMPEDWEGAPLRKDYTHPGLIRRPD